MIRKTQHIKCLIATLSLSLFSSLPVRAVDIMDTAVESGTSSTLLEAVKAADLVNSLKGVESFTVFAPTDEAFAALPEGTHEDLLKPESEDQLVAILTYHVVPGNVMSGDIAGKKNGCRNRLGSYSGSRRHV